MSKRIEGNQTENSGRNVQGSLDFSEINAYFEQEEDAPSAQEVFDHYWSVLEYVLSDDEKRARGPFFGRDCGSVGICSS